MALPPRGGSERSSGRLVPSKLHSDLDMLQNYITRVISTGQLNTSRCAYTAPPINVVVYHGPYSLEGDREAHLKMRFPITSSE